MDNYKKLSGEKEFIAPNDSDTLARQYISTKRDFAVAI